ncbi:hypothetical protein B0T21DRAFT_453767 [Apiosordaria backusii]|uniref:Uncharacterized protein n=1 Tax=Apiosordaria backusii TaxID=314023 RepID=A0AA40AT05_9PEZI|nr:hypothetical protein B0T21DRAFT_453767 [Apiosordaria backusii]
MLIFIGHFGSTCSRELPKCAACKPWPAPCNYARQFPDSAAASSSTTLEPAGNNNVDSSLPARLGRIEATLQTLTAAVTRLLAVSEAENPELEPKLAKPDEADKTDEMSPSKPTPAIITPPAISSLDEANAHLGSILTNNQPSPDNDHDLALQNLNDLTSALTSFRLDVSLDLTPSDSREYIIPDLQTGHLIIVSKFTPLTLFASTFFTPPSSPPCYTPSSSPSLPPFQAG